MGTIVTVNNTGPDEIDVLLGKDYTRHLRAGEQVSLSVNRGAKMAFKPSRGEWGGRESGGQDKDNPTPADGETEV